MQDQTDNTDNEDQENSEFESTEIIQTDNNTLDFNSPIDFSDHNNSIATQAETDNSYKESKAIESEDESDSKPFESESIDFDVDSDVDSGYDIEDPEAMKTPTKTRNLNYGFWPKLAHTSLRMCRHTCNKIQQFNLP